MDDELLEESAPDPENLGSALDPAILTRLSRVRTELEWLADSPSHNLQEAEPRLRLFYARLLARVMYAMPMAEPFVLKGEERAEADESQSARTVEIRIYTAWARRLISRDFYFLQRKLFRWSPDRRINAYLDEFHLRAADVLDTFPVDDRMISLLPYFTASVRITCPVAGALMDRLCDADRHYASAMYKETKEKGDRRFAESQQMLTEPLLWMKGRAGDTPTSRFPLRAAGMFVSPREEPARRTARDQPE